MEQFNHYPKVFTPIQVGKTTLKNRIQFAPMVSAHADPKDGSVTRELEEFVAMQARTGASLITIGSTPVDYDRSRDFVGALSVSYDTDIPGLVKLSHAAHRYGAKISVELTHAGFIADKYYLNGKKAFAASVLPGMENVEEISHSDMAKVADAFADCAVRLKKAGFDGVMIHGAHGVNLVSSFLSPIYNHRTDEYGGSLENRMRYPLEILQTVREAVGDSMIIEYRISGLERKPGTCSLEDTIAFLQKAQAYIDVVNISGGMLVGNEICYSMPTYHMPHELNVEPAAAIRKALDIPVSVVGNITTMAEAEQILEDGSADMISMVRNMLADPDFIKKSYAGREEEIRPCVRCYECAMSPKYGESLRCAVNPVCGAETKYSYIPKAEKKKKVMIVGGGPAGMTAAQTCAKRGHDVTLYEKEERLGGRLYEVGALYTKDGYRSYLDYVVRQTLQCGCKVVTGTEVTPELVEKENPDVLILAVGADVAVPRIKGIDGPNVVKVDDADLQKVPIGQKVVICGAGLSGAECGAQLQKEGHEVTLVDFKESQDFLAPGGNDLVRLGLNHMLEELKVEQIYGVRVSEIRENGISYCDKEGKEHFLEADTVINAFGMKPRRAVVESMDRLVPETYVFGDAFAVGNVYKANQRAFEVCVEI